MGTGEFNAGRNTEMDLHPIQGGVEILLVASCYRNRDKLQPGGPLGSYADLTFTFTMYSQTAKCIMGNVHVVLVYHWLIYVYIVSTPWKKESFSFTLKHYREL